MSEVPNEVGARKSKGQHDSQPANCSEPRGNIWMSCWGTRETRGRGAALFTIRAAVDWAK